MTQAGKTSTLTSDFRSQVENLRDVFDTYQKPQMLLTSRMELIWQMFTTKQIILAEIRDGQ